MPRAASSTNRFVAVVGASGSGKSSLALGGHRTAPRRRRRRATRVRIPHDHSNDAGILGDDSTPSSIVDQLEELVTLCHDPIERTAFVDAARWPSRRRWSSRSGRPVRRVRRVHRVRRRGWRSSQVLLGPLAETTTCPGRAGAGPAMRPRRRRRPGRAHRRRARRRARRAAAARSCSARGVAAPRRPHDHGRRLSASGGVRSAIATTAERALAALDDAGQRVARTCCCAWSSCDQKATTPAAGRRATSYRRSTPARRDVVATLADCAPARRRPRPGRPSSTKRAARLAPPQRVDRRGAHRPARPPGASRGDGAMERRRTQRRRPVPRRAPRRGDRSRRARAPPDAEAEFVEAGRSLRDRERVEASPPAPGGCGSSPAVASVLAAVALVVGAIAVVQRNDAHGRGRRPTRRPASPMPPQRAAAEDSVVRGRGATHCRRGGGAERADRGARRSRRVDAGRPSATPRRCSPSRLPPRRHATNAVGAAVDVHRRRDGSSTPTASTAHRAARHRHARR